MKQPLSFSPGRSAWRDDVRDGYCHVLKRERAECLAGGEGEGDLILSISRLAEDFEDVLLEIDDPILADAGFRVGGELALAVVGEAGVGDFHEEEYILGTRVALQFAHARDEHHVGLRLGVFVQPDGIAGGDDVAAAALIDETLVDPTDCLNIAEADGGHDDDFSIEQFDAIPRVKDADLAELVKFLDGKPVGTRLGLRHCRDAAHGWRLPCRGWAGKSLSSQFPC